LYSHILTISFHQSRDSRISQPQHLLRKICHPGRQSILVSPTISRQLFISPTPATSHSANLSTTKAYHAVMSTNPPPSDMWQCSECGEWNMSWYDRCPTCDRGCRQSVCHGYQSSSYGAGGDVPGYALQGAGSAAPGSWECANCGAANSSLTPDFCPICGVRR
jgi:hypothetical protein